MTRKSGGQPLKTLERAIQSLEDQVRALPEAGRRELTVTLQEVARAMAAVKEACQAETDPQQAPPDCPEAADTPYSCDTILHQVFSAIPDTLTVIDRDFNIIMSNWHGFDRVPAEIRRGRPTCYRIYHHRDRPCEDCHVQKVFASGQPQKTEKISLLDGRTREFSAFPVQSESGQVILAAEHVRDVTGRCQAAKALKESEERFRAIFESAQDAIFIKDRSLRYTQVNPAMERLFDQPAADLIAKTDKDLFGTAAGVQIRAQDRRALSGEVVIEANTRLVRGAHKTFHVVKVPLHDDAGQVMGVCGIARDITDLKQAEEALKESEEWFKLLFAYAPDAYYLMDMQGNFLDGNLISEELTGYGREELTGRNYQDIPLFDEQQNSMVAALFQQGLDGKILGQVELNLNRKNGGKVIIEAKGLVLHRKGESLLLGIARDITARKAAEAALRGSEERYRVLFEGSRHGIVVVDMETGRFGYANPSICRMLGYSEPELRQLGIADIHPKDSLNQVMVEFESLARDEKAVSSMIPCLRKDGTVFYADITSAQSLIQGRIYSVGFFIDVTERRRAEEALKKSEATLRGLIEANPESLLLLDREGVTLAASRVAAQRLDKSLEEIIGADAFALVPPEVGRKRFEIFQQVVATGQPRRYEDIRGAFHLDICMNPILDQDQVVQVAVLAMDLTARKQAEAALLESEERYRALFEASPDAIIVMDLEMNIIMGNRRGAEMVGYDNLEQAMSRKGLDDITPEDRPRVMTATKALLETGRTQTLEVTMVKRDGARFPSLNSAALIRDTAGRPQAIIGVARDISDLKQAEAELRESEQRFRLMAETIQDAFWIATPALDQVLYASPAYESIWGYSCQDLYQHPRRFVESIHPEDQARALAAIVTAREQGSASDHEYRIIKPDGAVRWIHDRGYPVRDDQGRVILFTGVARDITEGKALEQQLLQAQKMEAVGRLAGGVAHDFNNLLMAITGYGELMRAKVVKDDPLYGYLEHILEAGDRAAALTQQLLTFSRQKIIHPKVVDLNRVVLDLEPMLRRLIGEDLDLEVAIDPRPGAVKADPDQLSQIIMNLVVNARDAMPHGGRLTLKTALANFSEGCQSRFGLIPPGAYVMLTVQDTGTGMNEAIQTHAFEPFFTTKEPGKGTGLGLSTVYGIVKQSGGYLDLLSSPGAGSTFTIYLPRLEALVALPKARAPITASFQGDETVLLVEDEEVLRALLAKFLKIYGYTVLEARHGGEALLLCERHSGPIHVMVTDVVMPKMSGRELANRLILLRPEMKIIFMSGYTEDTLAQHGVADLSVVFLQKPFKPIELARRVHAVLHSPAGR